MVHCMGIVSIFHIKNELEFWFHGHMTQTGMWPDNSGGIAHMGM